VHRWSLIVAALALAVAVFVPSALGAEVHVRVEGKTRSIFGPREPVLSAGNALEALDAASAASEFYYHVTPTGFGPYIDQIGRFPAGGSSGWVFKVNGASPPVGADQVTLKDGDSVLWYWADFSTGSGPKTLRLTRTRANCYRVLAVDDTGAGAGATGAVLHVGSRRTVRTRGGAACVGRHRGLLVRATLAGAVRSNALP
jgi:Domain of unknown function (DUF4430)